MNYYEHAQLSRQNQLSMEQVEKLIEYLRDEQQKSYSTVDHIKHRINGAELKREALSKKPTPLEKTMSMSQLYASGSPLWAKEFSPLTLALYSRVLKIKGKEYVFQHMTSCLNNMDDCELKEMLRKI